MKTAVQQIANEIVDDNLGKNTLNLTFDQMTKIIGIMHNHLETEKQQIIEVYNQGWQYGFLANSKELQPTKNSETYFNETFNNQENEF